MYIGLKWERSSHWSIFWYLQSIFFFFFSGGTGFGTQCFVLQRRYTSWATPLAHFLWLLGLVVHTCNPSTLEREGDRPEVSVQDWSIPLLWVSGEGTKLQWWGTGSRANCLHLIIQETERDQGPAGSYNLFQGHDLRTFCKFPTLKPD
jgi:hypothetical protein